MKMMSIYWFNRNVPNYLYFVGAMLSRWFTVKKVIHVVLIVVIILFFWHNYRNLHLSSRTQTSTLCPLVNESLCESIFEGSLPAIEYAKGFSWCRRNDLLSDADYLSITKDCWRFIADHGYNLHPTSDEELHFPIAFSILMHENVEQVERLLRLIYRPQNFYCIHVDRKSSPSVHAALNAVARCFENVFVSSNVIDVHWGEYSLLEAELSCLRQLLDKFSSWKYYINLMGREFPLRTNRQLVHIFKTYNGANDVDGTHHRL